MDRITEEVVFIEVTDSVILYMFDKSDSLSN